MQLNNTENTHIGKFPIVEKIDTKYKKSIIVSDSSGKQEKYLELEVLGDLFSTLEINHFYEIEYLFFSKPYGDKWFTNAQAIRIVKIH